MKKSIIAITTSLASFYLFSTLASAQSAVVIGVSTGIGSFAGLIMAFTAYVVKAVGTLFMAAAMVAFFYGIVEYIWGSRQGDGTKIKNGNQFMIWGLVGLFVMFSVYGIIQFAQGTLFGGTGIRMDTITIPSINFVTGGSPNSANVRDPLGGGGAPNSANVTSPLGGGNPNNANVVPTGADRQTPTSDLPTNTRKSLANCETTSPSECENSFDTESGASCHWDTRENFCSGD